MNASISLPTALQLVFDLFHQLFTEVYKKPRYVKRPRVRKKTNSHLIEESPPKEGEPESWPEGLYLPQSGLDDLTLEGADDTDDEEGIEVHYFDE